MFWHLQTAAADTPWKYTKKEIVMEEFRFLKPRKMKHPTTGIDLEYLDKSNAVCIALFNEEKDKITNGHFLISPIRLQSVHSLSGSLSIHSQ